MITDWQTLYREAQLECDPKKVHKTCERARYAINDRALELAKERADGPEREELEEALRQLMVHEMKIAR